MSLQDGVSYTAIPKSMVAKNTESPPSPPDTEENPVQWHISLRTPFSMLVPFASGILVSVGHHLFYSYLDGSAVQNPDEGSQYLTQIWIIRYGTAFAFLSKALLTSAVVVAYKQHIWINLRARANPISTIDAMFAATYDILAFLNPSLLLKAKILSLMAFIIWFLPLAALITPSTLTVAPSIRENTTMMHVPTLNFNDSSLYTFSGLGDGSSPLLTRLTFATLSNMQILPLQAIAANTTYHHEFLGPSLKCEPATGQRLEDVNNIWNTTFERLQASAGGQVMYLAYTRQDTSTSSPLLNLQDFVDECVLSDRPGPSCGESYDPAISVRVGDESISCTLYDTHFDLDFRAVGNTQTLAELHFEWLQKSDWGNGSFKAISRALATILNGAIGAWASGPQAHQDDSGSSGLSTYQTRVMSTALIGFVSTAFSAGVGRLLHDLPQEDRDLAANRTLGGMIEELSRNQTLSLFSSNRLWLPQNATNTTLVTHSTFTTIYEYRSRNLIMTYAIAIACSAFGVLLGLRALWLNGICHETSFSSIMSTTRNKYLDDLTLGYSLGSAPTPHAVKKIELRFGELLDVGSREKSRAAFGLETDVVSLRKGRVIY
ncbi:hypothetical protein COCVIDRAFT_23142 [Bipolaris victoriae FI3]|uniref:Uncharacterized protein n=1 Tax=Bipolaris victoriae (strain FI3) TaxID=930091 RepID=W7EZH8_BIPV3|nr:hypothetical protein COCVIDRAFT_23142 [Bipolaris victoriae FI3]